MTHELNKLSDDELLGNLSKLSWKENETTAEILLHLIEVESRRAYLAKGYSSLFSYCTGALKYSEGAAMRRLSAARTIQKYPEVLEMFLKKEVTLCTISLLQALLTPENKAEVLSAVQGKLKSEVERFVATCKPKSIVRESIRPLALKVKENDEAPRALNLTATGGGKKVPEPTKEVEIRHEFKFSVPPKVMAKFNELKTIVGNKSLEEIFSMLLEEYLEKHSPVRREQRRQSKQPAQAPKTHGAVSRTLRDKILVRDGLQCSYISADGTRCSCKTHLQIDHIHPRGLGGSNSLDNLRVLCSAHNKYEAERVYGKEFMSKFY